MNWLWLLLIPGNWLLAWLLSWVYVGWLWKLSGDVRFEGGVKLWGWLPVARFLLISRRSWFAKMWEKWYGCAAFLVMIHRDEPGERDDRQVEDTIVHEARHNVQALWFGALFFVVYGIETIRVGYRDNWFERDARTAVVRWNNIDRPNVERLGVRR